jgi:hypothetical protein
LYCSAHLAMKACRDAAPSRSAGLSRGVAPGDARATSSDTVTPLPSARSSRPPC